MYASTLYSTLASVINEYAPPGNFVERLWELAAHNNILYYGVAGEYSYGDSAQYFVDINMPYFGVQVGAALLPDEWLNNYVEGVPRIDGTERDFLMPVTERNDLPADYGVNEPLTDAVMFQAQDEYTDYAAPEMLLKTTDVAPYQAQDGLTDTVDTVAPVMTLNTPAAAPAADNKLQLLMIGALILKLLF